MSKEAKDVVPGVVCAGDWMPVPGWEERVEEKKRWWGKEMPWKLIQARLLYGT